MNWMNEARTRRGRTALAHDPRIVPVAREWSAHLSLLQRLTHNLRHRQQIFALRPEASTTSENVGWSNISAHHIFDLFMGSLRHRWTILSGRYSRAAVGCTVDDEGKLWATVNFWG